MREETGECEFCGSPTEPGDEDICDACGFGDVFSDELGTDDDMGELGEFGC